MKVLLLGKSGMLGSCFLKYLSGSEDFETYAFGKEDLDITDFPFMKTVFNQISPDFVINCSGFTAVDDCEVNKIESLKINADAVEEMAEICKKLGATLIHFSTDYVFDGTKQNGYKESDSPHPINAYGHSKLEGEKRLMLATDKYYIIRTSWLYGENGRNFVDRIIELGKEKSEIEVVNDQFGCPTYTMDLAKAVISYFLYPHLQELKRHHPHDILWEDKSNIPHIVLPSGVYHIVNFGSTNWYDFAKEILKLANIKSEVVPTSSDHLQLPAKRPANSVLLNTKTKPLRSWQEALKVYLEFKQ